MNSTPLAALFVLLAFAANSVLCRLALHAGGIDPASFTVVRLLAGAATLWLLVRFARRGRGLRGDWAAALALFVYAVTFSLAYVAVSTGTGALLLFGAVQLIMIVAGLLAGERIDWLMGAGWFIAVAGLILLMLPGVAAPPLLPALLMLCAGIAWGVYSLRGRHSVDPLCDTAGNFVRCVPLALLLALAFWPHARIDREGLLLAALSGAVASGLGYAAWYTVLPKLSAIVAANLQLAVPVIAALGGVVFSAESISVRLAVATVLVLGGIALLTQRARRRRAAA
jgi:drug/metabolite transporter (DMT)-like permease